jgi:homoserine kinase
MPAFPMAQAVEVFAPATVANLGPGFDILGLALAEPYDVIDARRIDEPGVFIESITGDDGRLPLEPEKNTAGIAAACVLDQLMIRSSGVALSIQKGLPLESGLGSSAASAVGAAIAVNALFGNSLRRQDLLPACIEAEAAVSGRHADNVAPALLGGIVLITGLTPDAIYRLPTPEGLTLALVTPAVSVPTAEARAVLPKTISLSHLVRQSSAVALLVSAIYSGNVPLMAQAMERDVVVEPARQHLMPGLAEVREAARKVGAFGTVISGAGPTICSVCSTTDVARCVAEAMASVYTAMGIEAETRVTAPSPDGATLRVLEA